MTQEEFYTRYDHITYKFTRTSKIIKDAYNVFKYLCETDSAFKSFVDSEKINHNNFFMYHNDSLVFANFRTTESKSEINTCSLPLDKVCKLIDVANAYFKHKKVEVFIKKDTCISVEDDEFFKDL